MIDHIRDATEINNEEINNITRTLCFHIEHCSTGDNFSKALTSQPDALIKLFLLDIKTFSSILPHQWLLKNLWSTTVQNSTTWQRVSHRKTRKLPDHNWPERILTNE